MADDARQIAERWAGVAGNDVWPPEVAELARAYLVLLDMDMTATAEQWEGEAKRLRAELARVRALGNQLADAVDRYFDDTAFYESEAESWNRMRDARAAWREEPQMCGECEPNDTVCPPCPTPICPVCKSPNLRRGTDGVLHCVAGCYWREEE